METGPNNATTFVRFFLFKPFDFGQNKADEKVEVSRNILDKLQSLPHDSSRWKDNSI